MLIAGGRRRTRWFATALACALAACVAARADAGPIPEAAGEYAFEAFRASSGPFALPDELRAGELVDGPRYGTHTVEFTWVGREQFNLRGYRLTATVEGGPLSGLAARWTVTPGSGRALGVAGQRAYRVHLPIPTDGRPHVRAVLEALGAGGAPVLLAEHDAVPQPDPDSQTFEAGPAHVLAGSAGQAAWVGARSAPALAALHVTVAARLANQARRRPDGLAKLFADAQSHAPRGPPRRV